MFRKADVVSYYICGLKPSAWEPVAQHVLLDPVEDLLNLDDVKQAAVAIGNYQRALSTLEGRRKATGGPMEKEKVGS